MDISTLLHFLKFQRIFAHHNETECEMQFQKPNPAVSSEISPKEGRILSDPDAFLTELQAAELLGISHRTLQTLRVRGGGPVFSKFGASVRYQRKNLIAWAENRAVANTSQVGSM